LNFAFCIFPVPDTALSDVVSLLGNGTLNTVAGGDAQTLIDHRTDLCVDGDKNNPYQRSDGDLEVVYALLNFLGNEDTANVLSKAVYGVLTDDGVNIGGLNGIVGGLVDLGEINGILTNLTSIDTALSDVVSLLGNGLLSTVAGGDAQTLIDHRTDLCVNGNKNDPYQRSDGDLEVVYALLNFLGNEEIANVVSKAVYGVLTSDGVNIGGLNGIVAEFVPLGEMRTTNLQSNISSFFTNRISIFRQTKHCKMENIII